VSAGKNVPFSVFVDYAHTPDALENVLKTIREFAKRRVICVFGCGGNRDRAKRPIMGEIAGRFSDLAIITSDNPRNENPMDIIDTIEEGVKRSGTHYLVIENRRDAIAHALELAEPEDVVLIAGKGHENYQEINGTKYHFDDKEIVEELLRKRV
jgi:UDP-N-acetylmuramoyl-L-alanyl-D-glutamate--2,6-diaminopimelate ligase